MDYQGKTYVVWGLGISGVATIEFLLQKGARVMAIDKKIETFKNRFPSSVQFFTEQDPIPWKQGDFLIKTPGISPEPPLFVEAQKHLLLTSEIDIACQEIAKRGKKLLAITGSNGKTTTTLLTTHLLNEAGMKALATGNVGEPLIAHVQDDVDVYVVELSSFQIEMLQGQYFHAAVILNITPNHLDRYSTFEQYACAKIQLEKHLLDKGTCIVSEKVQADFRSLFSVHQPLVFSSLQEKIETICSLSYRVGGTLFAPHDGENVGAAMALCQRLGFSQSLLEKGLKNFHKPAHRLEYLGAIKGVHFVNDSKATSVDAVEKAITAIPGHVHLIAGGVDKGGDYHSWVPFFKGKVKCVFTIGQAAGRIKLEIGKEIPIECADSLQEAVRKSFSRAQEGDTVLLSPGCSSYDQFKDFQERGNCFKECVTKLKVET